MEEKWIKREIKWQKQEENMQGIKAAKILDFVAHLKVELTVEELVRRGK